MTPVTSFAPLPDDVTLPDEVTSFSPARWRVEVLRQGRYWQWRARGRGGASRYGGKFGTLSAERQAQYERNKKRNKKAVPA